MRLNDRTAESHLPSYRCSLQNIHLSGNNTSRIFSHFYWPELFEQTALAAGLKEDWMGTQIIEPSRETESLFSPQSHLFVKKNLSFFSPERMCLHSRAVFPLSISRKADGQKCQLAYINSTFHNFRVCLSWYKIPAYSQGISRSHITWRTSPLHSSFSREHSGNRYYIHTFSVLYFSQNLSSRIQVNLT